MSFTVVWHKPALVTLHRLPLHSAIIVDRSTMSAEPLSPGAGPLATAEVLRSAGWDARLIGPATPWAQAWADLTARQAGAGVRS